MVCMRTLLLRLTPSPTYVFFPIEFFAFASMQTSAQAFIIIFVLVICLFHSCLRIPYTMHNFALIKLCKKLDQFSIVLPAETGAHEKLERFFLDSFN